MTLNYITVTNNAPLTKKVERLIHDHAYRKYNKTVCADSYIERIMTDISNVQKNICAENKTCKPVELDIDAPCSVMDACPSRFLRAGNVVIGFHKVKVLGDINANI